MVSSRLVDGVAAHPVRVVGLLGVSGGLAHAGLTLSTALPTAGDPAATAATVAIYATDAPAYVAAVAVGVALLVWGD